MLYLATLVEDNISCLIKVHIPDSWTMLLSMIIEKNSEKSKLAIN